jgi:hypothetical protein
VAWRPSARLALGGAGGSGTKVSHKELLKKFYFLFFKATHIVIIIVIATGI